MPRTNPSSFEHLAYRSLQSPDVQALKEGLYRSRLPNLLVQVLEPRSPNLDNQVCKQGPCGTNLDVQGFPARLQTLDAQGL